ncbi:hypothetical protein [Roseomonas sp. BN140053]
MRIVARLLPVLLIALALAGCEREGGLRGGYVGGGAGLSTRGAP